MTPPSTGPTARTVTTTSSVSIALMVILVATVWRAGEILQTIRTDQTTLLHAHEKDADAKYLSLREADLRFDHVQSMIQSKLDDILDEVRTNGEPAKLGEKDY